MALSSLEKALNVLTLFDHERKSLSALEISRELSIPLSSTYRYLDVLHRNRFLEKDAGTSNQYHLGLLVFKLGTIALSGFDLVAVANPYMRSLAKLSGETVYLAVSNNREAMCLETVESERQIKLSQKKGSTLPLHAGATSKILLAFQGDRFFHDFVSKKALAKLSRNTITDPEKLEKEMDTIRRRGYATSEAEVDEMASAVAAPIFNHEGEIAASISISGPAQRMEGSIPRFVDLVKETAERISHDLGYELGVR